MDGGGRRDSFPEDLGVAALAPLLAPGAMVPRSPAARRSSLPIGRRLDRPRRCRGVEDVACLTGELRLAGYAFGLARRETRKLARLRIALRHARADASDEVARLDGEAAG